MKRFYYNSSMFGKYTVLDKEDGDFHIIVGSDVHAIVLCDLLNKLIGKVDYQERVIDKSLKELKKYKFMVNDRDELISKLDKEKRILKKIILEEME